MATATPGGGPARTTIRAARHPRGSSSTRTASESSSRREWYVVSLPLTPQTANASVTTVQATHNSQYVFFGTSNGKLDVYDISIGFEPRPQREVRIPGAVHP